jgi:Aspartyl/Asparaginyl beta-hydroxylase
MDAFKLPFTFDPKLLQADLEQVAAAEWIRHYRNDEYEGEWAIAPLRSVAGHPAVIHAVPIGKQYDYYQDTPILERCAYFKTIIEQFKCPIGSVRLMLLGAGARILEHKDDMGADDVQEMRIHIPIQTNEDVHFWVNQQRIHMLPGETWYADFSQLHRVENNSNEARIHLVLDCQTNEWLRHLLQIAQICHFLDSIGIPCIFESIPNDTFLPGVSIVNGALKIDTDRLQYPGDLLHEAGHIAVTPAAERPNMCGNVGVDDPQAMGQEIATILWSYAALSAMKLPPEVVFHPNGYKGASDWHIENFTSGNYIGLPLLQWMGMTNEDFPVMQSWLRQSAQ